MVADALWALIHPLLPRAAQTHRRAAPRCWTRGHWCARGWATRGSDLRLSADKALFTIEEAGQHLALSRASVYRLIGEGQLRRVYPRPRAARITGESLAAHLERAAQPGQVAQVAREKAQDRKEQRRGGLLGRWGLGIRKG